MIHSSIRFRPITSALVLLSVLTLAGCGGGSGESASSGSAGAAGAGESAGGGSVETAGSSSEKRGTIGYTTMSLTNPFFKVISDAMTEEAAAHGYDVITVSGDDDVSKQSNQVDDFIVQGVDAIVITPCDPKSIGAAIRRANEAGIPVFTNDTGYDGSEGEVECHVATDNFQGGELAGQAMVDLLGKQGGKVLIVHKPDASSCLLRVAGFTTVVDAHNEANPDARIEVVSTLDGRGARDAGYAVTRDALVAHPDISAVFAINDPSALGACTAIEESGRQDRITVIGFDGEMAGKKAILEGRIHCDPIQFPDRMGRQTIEVIMKYFNAEEIPAEILIPSELYGKAEAEQDPALR